MSRLLAIAIVGCVAGCIGGAADDPAGGEGSLALGVTVPDRLAATVTSVRLDVFDDLAACDVNLPAGGSLLESRVIDLGVPTSLRVSAGERTFHAIGLDQTSEVASGCAEATLIAGETTELAIQLVENPPDAGP